MKKCKSPKGKILCFYSCLLQNILPYNLRSLINQSNLFCSWSDLLQTLAHHTDTSISAVPVEIHSWLVQCVFKSCIVICYLVDIICQKSIMQSLKGELQTKLLLNLLSQANWHSLLCVLDVVYKSQHESLCCLFFKPDIEQQCHFYRDQKKAVEL